VGGISPGRTVSRGADLYDATARVPFESVMARWLAAISALILSRAAPTLPTSCSRAWRCRRLELAVRIALGSGARVMRLLALEGLLLAGVRHC
jgi:hypothetical protein